MENESYEEFSENETASPRGARLSVVATPIGNLSDLSPRARETLAAADFIACEDTRTTGNMLRRFGISRPLLAHHEHNEQASAAGIAARIAEGARAALVCDAGTPTLSSCRSSPERVFICLDRPYGLNAQRFKLKLL